MKRIILFVLLFIIFGCKENEVSREINVDMFKVKLKSASKVFEEDLPKWLVIRINDYYETRLSSFYKVMIYRGEWNKQTVFFILDTNSSCLCDFYTKDGEKIVDNLPDLRVTSKNWVLVYEYGDIVLDLDKLFQI